MNVTPGRPRNRRRLSSLSRGIGLGALALLPAGGALYAFYLRPPATPAAKPKTTARAAPKAGRGPAAARRAQADQTTEGHEPEPQPSASMEGLGEELRDLARQAPSRAAAIYVEDIPSGQIASVNPNRPFVAASLIKLPVMGAVYERWQARPELKTNAVRWWVEQMITVSDNRCTNRLTDFLGGIQVVNRFCQKRGWPNIRFRHALRPYSGPRRANQVTAREIGELLAALDRGKLVNAVADAEMWGVLRRQKLRQRIPAGLPDLPDLEIGSKTGTLPSVLHDAAIIHTPRSRYVLCILLSLPRSEPAGDQFCRLVSRRVFEHMDGEEVSRK